MGSWMNCCMRDRHGLHNGNNQRRKDTIPSQKGGKMKTLIFICIAAIMAVVTNACSSTFLVYKPGQDGRGCFLGSNSKAKYEMLCESGDLEKVLAATHLSGEMKETFYKYNCSTERSGEKVKEIYASMTVEQRKDIKNAFRQNGYEINHILC